MSPADKGGGDSGAVAGGVTGAIRGRPYRRTYRRSGWRRRRCCRRRRGRDRHRSPGEGAYLCDVRTYVTSNKIDPVYLDGEVVVGAGFSDTVELREIPDYEYRYVCVNGLPVPGPRKITADWLRRKVDN